jgi:hypothetical protein
MLRCYRRWREEEKAAQTLPDAAGITDVPVLAMARDLLFPLRMPDRWIVTVGRVD